MHGGKEDIMVLVCHVISHDLVESCDFMGRNLLR